MKKVSNFFVVIIFALIICTPALLWVCSHFTSKKLDVDLNGQTQDVTQVELSLDAFVDGSYQSNVNSRLNSNILPRGVMIRTYSTINYELFRTGNRIIGNNGDIFESIYVNETIGIGPDYDFSNPDNVIAMENYVNTLVELDSRLQSMGKHLFVYVVPDKAKFNLENIPLRYRLRYDENRLTASRLFRSLIERTDVPVMFAYDFHDEINYPLYYTTGIHWSRPYEQYTTCRVISELNNITGMNYRVPILGEAIYSTAPYWRDDDVYGILNTWGDARGNYYQFEMTSSYPEQFDRLHAFVCGDSFGLGLQHDLNSVNRDDDLTFMFYNQYTINLRGEQINLANGFESLDMQAIVDNTDVFIVEMNESNIPSFEVQFPTYLLNYLDGYIPSEPAANNLVNFDGSISDDWNGADVYGLFGYEAGYSWCGTEVTVTLNNANIAINGLEMNFAVPEGIADAVGNNHMHLYINGVLVNEFDALPGDNLIIISPDDMAARGVTLDGDSYEIIIFSDKVYNPMEMGAGDDSRNLSYQLFYLGEVRQ